jgi:hypothetical protein
VGQIISVMADSVRLDRLQWAPDAGLPTTIALHGTASGKTITSGLGRVCGDGAVEILQPTLTILDRLLAWLVEPQVVLVRRGEDDLRPFGVCESALNFFSSSGKTS